MPGHIASITALVYWPDRHISLNMVVDSSVMMETTFTGVEIYVAAYLTSDYFYWPDMCETLFWINYILKD